MSGNFETLHPRDEHGRFREKAARKLVEQVREAVKRGDFSSGFTPVARGHHQPPRALQEGFIRVGDHPTRMGAVGGEESYFGSSTHPAAGGIWVDPDRPGTQVAPRFVNDYGSPVAALTPVKSRSQQRKEDLSSRRREDWAGTPEDRERRAPSEGGKIGRRFEGASPALLKDVHRVQARARVETSARTPKRRTPRGTPVGSWMDTVNRQMEARRGT